MMPRSPRDHIDTPKAFGKRLKKSRLQVGVSQRKLSFPGCTAAYLSRLEAGERVPSLQMVIKLAEKLSVDPSWLAKGVASDNRHLRALLEIKDGRLTSLEMRELASFVLAGGEPEKCFR